MRASFLPICAAALGALCVLSAACGNVITTGEAAATSGGTGGGAGTSSAGSGGASPEVDAGGTDAGGQKTCGGEAGLPCDDDEWCQFDPSAACGGFDDTGTCQPKPDGCFDDCPGVCGCDGQFYCNACSAHLAGVDVHPDLDCFAGGYRAVNLFTGAPRFAILKADPVRNLCFRLRMELNASALGVSGDGWGIDQAEVTDQVSDCSLMNGVLGPTMGNTHSADAGSGKLAVGAMPGACTTGIHAVLSFSGGPAWVPPMEPFDADDLVIEGGCP